MSEFNEELLNDVDDYPDIGDADEEALLQDDDDGDVLDLAPEELEETLDDSQTNIGDNDEESEETRHEKFLTERPRITAPETSAEELNPPRPNVRFQRPNNRGFQRGRGGNITGRGRFQGRGKFTYGNQPGRNKTVLINPRFQGVVHVNNNARLAWDTSQQQQYQQNPWASGNPPTQMGRPMQHIQGHLAGSPMQPIQTGTPMQQEMHGFHGTPHMQPNYQGLHMPPMHQESPMQHGPMTPVQNIGPPGHQLQYIPPQQQPYMPQPLPPGVQQAPMQYPPAVPCWDGQNQYTSIEQRPNHQNQFMQHNYQQSPPIMMHPNQHPPPQVSTPNFQMYHQPNNMSPMPPQHFNNNPNFVVPHNNQVFSNNQGNMQYNQDNRHRQAKREIFTPKRKVMTAAFTQKKRANIEQPLPKVERPSVVKEVTVTNVTTVKIEEEDEETTDLRQKIEEQKRKREAILQWKEQRRLEKLTMGQTQDTPGVDQKVICPVQVTKQIVLKKEPMRAPVVQQVKPPVQPIEMAPVRPAKFKKPMGNNIVITNGYSRKVTKYQLKKAKEASRVVLAIPTTARLPVPEPELKLDKKHLSTFLADRKILTKDETLMSTRKVVIKNISTSTGDKKIFQISKSIGEVQKLHREKNERQATIVFKSVASAHAFFKKYQRHMLDLSMIEVALCPMSESDE